MAARLLFHICKKSYQMRYEAGFALLCAVFFITFCSLGVWQVHRHQFKKELLATYQKNIAANPENILAVKNIAQFQHVTVDGQYISGLTMLVQNRIYHDQIGYEVLTPIKLSNQKLLMIDRGWVPQNQLVIMPKIADVKQHVKGYIKFVDESQFILGKNIFDPKTQPLVMQKIDIEEIKKITHQDFYPFILRLDASEPNGFVRDWIISAMPPERHLGYAVQWFALALMVFIAFFCFCFAW